MNKENGFVAFITTILRMAFISMAASLILTFGSWVFHRERGFLVPFLCGAAAIFIVWLLISIVKTMVTLIRFKRDPMFKDANLKTGMDWETYKRFREDL